MPPIKVLFPALAAMSLAAQSGWRTHQDAAGFEMQVPANWQVQQERSGLISATSPQGEAFTLIIPIPRLTQPCEAFLADSFRQPSRRFPSPQILGIRPAGPRGQAVADLRFAQGAGRAAVLCAPINGNAMLYAVAAPAQDFPVAQPVLVRMLKSFRFGGGRASGPGAGGRPAPLAVRLVGWQDPLAGAFQVGVPDGWDVSGGLKVHTALFRQLGIRLADRRTPTVLQLNDPRFVALQVPMQGMPEGQTFAGPGGAPVLMLRYLPGAEFAERYLAMSFAQENQLQGVQMVAKQRRPDIERQHNASLRQLGGAGQQHQGHAGEIAFRATRSGRPVEGYVLATTTISSSSYAPGMYQWTVSVLGLITEPGGMPAAFELVRRVNETFQWNPAWVQRNAQDGNRMVQMLNEQTRQSYEALSSSYWSRQNPPGSTPADRFSDYMRDQVRLQTADGTQYVAPSGKNYYSLNRPSDTIWGTDTTFPPSIDLEPLTQVR
jgi:hypothetical protein